MHEINFIDQSKQDILTYRQSTNQWGLQEIKAHLTPKYFFHLNKLRLFTDLHHIKSL